MSDVRECPDCGRTDTVKDVTPVDETDRKTYLCTLCNERWPGEEIRRPQDEEGSDG